ncbi:hypothetical protein [Aquirufa aurantiipilula]
MKMNLKLASKAKKVFLTATLTFSFLAANSLLNPSQAKVESENRLWNGQCCPLSTLGNCGGY